ncbi:divergent polysaccharide deacetylase family protein [Isoalcanivorax beigongshangi]|uniref:Divergent polysaccharide deacetylase family protein n=1 Tax=Isoalcanivorax beigongshangi TaxID=3238810 RepID=A0ABV4AMC7_9GAMM
MKPLLVLLTALLWAPLALATDTPRIAVILDDIGYHRDRSQRALQLPPAITLAVIPRSPHGTEMARRAAARGHEILIHLPMAASGPMPLDPGGVDTQMSATQVARVLRDAFERVPQARGLNNHMGSAVTRDRAAMERVMQALATRHVYFIDSRTIGDSVAAATAARFGIAQASRDVFLDNLRDRAAINTQFNQLLAIARQRGHAIGIGHPYPETLEYLESALPLLREAGVELVPVSELLPNNWRRAAALRGR